MSDGQSDACGAPQIEELLDRVAERLHSANRVLVVTGAGISAESGVPTFRGEEGMYKGRDPMELASPQGFAADPVLVWEWYNWRKSIVAKAEPNAGHRTLAKWEERFDELLILTQNVDGLHQLAGSGRVVEFHGNIWRSRDTKTGRLYRRGEIETDGSEQPPLSPEGNVLRPDVVWFGEMLPRAPFEALGAFLRGGAVDVCLVIGTTALLPYIGGCALEAARAGAMTVEINPEPTVITDQLDIRLSGPSGVILPALDSRIS